MMKHFIIRLGIIILPIIFIFFYFDELLAALAITAIYTVICIILLVIDTIVLYFMDKGNIILMNIPLIMGLITYILYFISIFN